MRIIYLALALSLLAIGSGVLALATNSRPKSEIAPGVSLIEDVPNLPKLTLTIDVEGAVNHPGVLQLETKTGEALRLSQVIAAAGGLSAGADQDYVARNLNLAAIVSDGQKVYVPKKGENVQTPSSTQKININTASIDLILSLPGVGETRAKTIIDARPYSSLEDLKTKAKLPASLIEKIKEHVAF